MTTRITRVAYGLLFIATACGSGSDASLASFGFAGGSANGNTSLGRGGGTANGNTSGATQNPNGNGNSASVPGTPNNPVTEVVPVDPTNPSSVCSQSSFQPNAAPLDMFIMEDRSWSMSDPSAIAGANKWTVIVDALERFVSDPQSAGIGAGIGFFSLFVGAVPQGPGPETGISCDENAYAVPKIPIGQLDGTTGATAGQIITVLHNTSPAGWTPTRVAELGAVQYAQQYASQYPSHRVVVVLATDGLPNVCNSTVDSVAQAAADGVTGVNGSPIKTYVIGVYGAADQASPANLNQIAAAGGTGSAFVVNGGAAQAEQQFLTAMNSIRQAN